jgi:hypothetical protein
MLEMKVAIAHRVRNGGFTLQDAARASPRRRSVTIAPVAPPRRAALDSKQEGP